MGRGQPAGTPTADLTARRVRLTSPTACLVIAGVLLPLFIADVPLAGLARQSLNADGGSVPVWVSAAFAVAGFVLAWRKPANRSAGSCSAGPFSAR